MSKLWAVEAYGHSRTFDDQWKADAWWRHLVICCGADATMRRVD